MVNIQESSSFLYKNGNYSHGLDAHKSHHTIRENHDASTSQCDIVNVQNIISMETTAMDKTTRAQELLYTISGNRVTRLLYLLCSWPVDLVTTCANNMYKADFTSIQADATTAIDASRGSFRDL